MSETSRMRTALLILFLVVVWGVTWPISKIALAYTPPLLFSGLRTIAGGLLLLIFALPRYKQLRFRQTWPIYLISALFNIVGFYGLQNIGLGYLPAGLFSVIVYLQPVLIGVFAWLWLGESMSAVKIIGLMLGFAGVATVSAGGLSGELSVTGIVMALGTALAWALGTVYVKKVGTRVDSLWLVTIQCILGGIVLTGAGSATENWSAITWNLSFITSGLFLTIFSISAAWVTFFHLVSNGEASKVASYTLLVPVIAIFSSMLMIGEPFTMNLLEGLLLIVVSIYLVNRKQKKAGLY
ncbi:MAG: DMT family transporter, partial [Tumebacillaceae bacterium]